TIALRLQVMRAPPEVVTTHARSRPPHWPFQRAHADSAPVNTSDLRGSGCRGGAGRNRFATSWRGTEPAGVWTVSQACVGRDPPPRRWAARPQRGIVPFFLVPKQGFRAVISIWARRRRGIRAKRT